MLVWQNVFQTLAVFVAIELAERSITVCGEAVVQIEYILYLTAPRAGFDWGLVGLYCGSRAPFKLVWGVSGRSRFPSLKRCCSVKSRLILST